MAQVDTDGNHGLFLHEQLAYLHTGNTQKKVSNTASDEDIMGNNHMFVMLWNFPTMLFLFLAQNLKITSEATWPFKGTPAKIYIFLIS